MKILIVRIFRSSRTRISDFAYSSQWINDVVSFQNVLIQFRFDIERFRNSKIFQNFLIKFSIVISSEFSDSIFFSIFRLFRLETSISSISSISPDVLSFRRFRRNSVSEIHDSNFSFSSITSSYSSIITSNTSIDFVSDFNPANTRDISIEKTIYTQLIDSVMSDQKQSQDQLDSIIQTIITAAIIAVVIQTFVDFTAQFQRLQQNNAESNNERDDRRLFDSDSSNEIAIDADDDKSVLKNSKNIDFFDSRRENDKNKNVIVNVDRHIYYKNVFVFIDKLKNLKKNSFDHRVRELVVECLRDDALTWHSLKLNEIEKNMFRDASMNQWCRDLIRRFKKRDSQTLKNLQTEKYIMQDVRNDKTSKTYVQNIMRHFRIVEFNFIYNQLIMTWNNLNFNFKMQIFESTTTIIFISFFDSLDAKTSIWQEMTAHKFIQHVSFNSDQIDKQRQINKQNRERQNDFQQQFDVDDFQFFYFSYEYWSSSNYNSYQYQNSTFQNNAYQKYQKFQYQFSNASQKTFVVSVLSIDKQFLQLIFENASNFKFKNQSQRRLASDTKQDNRNEFDNRDDKSRAFVVDENNSEKEKIVKDFHNSSAKEKHENYYTENDNLNYYNSNQKNEIFVNFIASIVVTKSSLSHCRRCKKIFTFNNELHRHFRADCSLIFSKKSKFFSDAEIYSVKNVSSSTIDATKKISESSQSNIVTFVELTSSFTSFESIIIRFNVDSFADIDTRYEFRDWNYVKVKISFVVIVVSKDVCLNIDANVSFMNRNFFKTQTFNIFIRIMISSFQIRDLDTNRHENWKYVICDIHMFDTKNDQKITSLFKREIHFVDNLKINMFLNNDIIEFENFVIDIIKKHAMINNIDIIISLKIRFFKLTIQRFVHFKKIIVISSHVEMIVVVHHAELSITKDFLFESNDNFNFILYAHLVDAFIKSIIVRNDKEFPVMISRNFRLDKISEIDFFSDFHIDIDDENVKYFVVKESKFTHKNDWFKKFIFVCVVIYAVVAAIDNNFSITFAISSSLIILSQTSIVTSFVITLSQTSMSVAELRKTFAIRIDASDFEKFFTNVFISLVEIVLFNDVIVYNFDELNSFVKIVEKFSTFWQNIDFVEMSKKNWMKISLKSDWKKRVSKKTKMYSLNAKNKKLIDKIFDDLYRTDRMFWINQSTSFFYFCFCVWKNVDDEKKNRVIIDIRNLNVITQSDAYSLSLQTDIIIAMRNCDYISIIDCSAFFYQWRIHSNDRHKFTVVSHKNQKNFNVIVMNYKNSSTYV